MLGHLVLQFEELGQRAGEAVAPDGAASLGLDQLGVDAKAVAGLLDGTFEDVAHAQTLADLGEVEPLALQGEGRGGGEDEEGGDAGEGGDEVGDDAVDEVVAGRVAGQVGEGQDGEGGLVGEGEGFRSPASVRLGRASADSRRLAPLRWCGDRGACAERRSGPSGRFPRLRDRPRRSPEARPR